MSSKSKQRTNNTRMLPVEDREKAVLRQCVQARSQLETAIAGVTRAEAALRDNSREVKSQLHSCISRHLEFLRSRELWLLEQINIVQQLKEEALCQQLLQLHWLRGQFDILIHQLENSHSHDLANQLTSCMEKLSCLNLTPEETPDMTFQADVRSLRQAITSFGTIATQMEVTASSPLKITGSERPWLQQSCPIAAKKQKAEPELGTALADWLLGSHPASSSPVAYQPSKNPQDWLVSPAQRIQESRPLPPFDFSKAWDLTKDLEAWLMGEKTPARERTLSSVSTTSTFSIEKIDESEFILSGEEEEEEEEGDDELEEEKGMGEDEEEEVEEASEEPEDLSGWLVTPPPSGGELSDADRWRQAFRPFQESFRPGDWLSQPDCGSCCATRAVAVEIENLGLLRCLKQSPPASPASSPPASSPPASSLPAPAAGPAPSLEAWLARAPPVTVAQVCKANEPCGSLSQCVCEENCGREALCAWLFRRDGRDKNGKAGGKAQQQQQHQQQQVEAILQAWLHPGRGGGGSPVPPSPFPFAKAPPSAPCSEEKASREESCSRPENPFHGPLQSDSWVLPAKTQPAPFDAPAPADAEEDKWLLRKRAQAQERHGLPTVCDLFTCMKLGGDKEKWLHRAPIQM